MAGNIARRPDGRWRARHRDASGREHARHFDRKLDATRWLAGVEVAKSRGEWVDPALARIRFGDWARTWLDAQVQLKPSTRERYAVALRCHVLPIWERVPLAAMTHADVAAWVQQLVASGLKPGTVQYAHRVLSLVLAHAVRDGRLARNVAQGVRLPRVVRGEVVFLDHDQVERLAAASEPYGLLVRVLAYTGLRWGEATALRVGRLDLFRRRLHVVSAFAEVRGKLVEGTPKNHQVRWVPLPRFLVDELARYVAGLGPDELVFRSPKDGPLRNSNFRDRFFDKAVIASGLDGLTPHDLRHTAASLAVAAGANVKAVQRMLGHASAAMTLDVYAGLFGDDLDAVAERLDQAVSGRVADQVRTTGTGETVTPLPPRGRKGR
ncbi:MAG TPA: tyrosine-type recombinase/integrase [Actinomycetales bacterium]|nr:tyrosine-type recombinase/integrase [Actinomycetales bacterium]